MKQLPLLSHQLPETLWAMEKSQRRSSAGAAPNIWLSLEEDKQKAERGWGSGGQVGKKSTHLVRARSRTWIIFLTFNFLLCCTVQQRHSGDHRQCVIKVRGQSRASNVTSLKFSVSTVSAVHLCDHDGASHTFGASDWWTCWEYNSTVTVKSQQSCDVQLKCFKH